MRTVTGSLRSREQNRASHDPKFREVNWIEFYEHELKPRLTVERVFGELRGARMSGGKLRAPCPLHQGRDRNFAIDPETCCWFCHSQCNDGGGPIEFVHRMLGARGSPRGRAFIDIVKELAARCGIAVPETKVDGPTMQQEAESVWLDARAVTTDPIVVRWLGEERRLEPGLIAAYDLARVIPSHAKLPRWAGYVRDEHWHSWPSSGYCVIVPLVNARGRISSLRFRKPVAGAQGRSATGVSGVGLVMADAIARDVLATGRTPEFWTSGSFTILVAEGEPDFWSWATEPARRGLGGSATSFPAIIGAVSGSFGASVAGRLPVGTRIISAMDRDEGGDKIHAQLERVLVEADRNFTLSRWNPA